MGETLKEFIARRKRELDIEEADLRAKIGQIAAERGALRVAEEAADSSARAAAGDFEKARGNVRKIKPDTIMDSIIKILDQNPDGMIALDILAEINRHRHAPILRTSLSPQLSRLRQAGFIELHGSNWKLTKSSGDKEDVNVKQIE